MTKKFKKRSLSETNLSEKPENKNPSDTPVTPKKQKVDVAPKTPILNKAKPAQGDTNKNKKKQEKNKKVNEESETVQSPGEEKLNRKERNKLNREENKKLIKEKRKTFRREEGAGKTQTSKLSVEQIKEKIKELQGRESLSKSAKRKLAVFNKILQVQEGAGNVETSPGKEQVDDPKPTNSDVALKKQNKKRSVEEIAADNKKGKKAKLGKATNSQQNNEVENKNQTAVKKGQIETVGKNNKKSNKQKNTKVQPGGNQLRVQSQADEEEDEDEDDDEDEDEDEDEDDEVEEEEDEEEEENESQVISKQKVNKKNVEGEDEDEDEDEEEEEDEDEDEEDDDEDENEVEEENNSKVEEEEDEDEEEDDDEDEDGEEEEDENEDEDVGQKVKKNAKVEKKKELNDATKKKGNEFTNNKNQDPKKKRYVLHVSNIPFSSNADEIREHFLTKVSNIVDVRIPKTPDTHKPRGFCYVELGNQEDYEKALSLNQSLIKNRKIRVEYSTGAGRHNAKNIIVAKNKKFDALRKAGKLAGSEKKFNKKVNKGKQNANVAT